MAGAEALLDSNCFNPFVDSFNYDDQAPLFDNDFFVDSSGLRSNTFAYKDTFLSDYPVKPSNTNKRKASSQDIRVGEDFKDHSFKPFTFDLGDNHKLFDTDIQTLDDVFITEYTISKTPTSKTTKYRKKVKTDTSKSKNGAKKETKKSQKNAAAVALSKYKLSQDSVPKKSKKSAPKTVSLPLIEETFKNESSANFLVDSDWDALLPPRNEMKKKSASKSTNDAKGTKRRLRNRMKWSHDENIKLWECISKHGNNWTEIKKELQCRTYYQIKDKGRRLLSVKGWISGRNKKYSNDAMRSAKLIAQTVLSKKDELKTIVDTV